MHTCQGAAGFLFTGDVQGSLAFGAHAGSFADGIEARAAGQGWPDCGFVAGIVLIPLFKHRHVRLFAPPHRDG